MNQEICDVSAGNNQWCTKRTAHFDLIIEIDGTVKQNLEKCFITCFIYASQTMYMQIYIK